MVVLTWRQLLAQPGRAAELVQRCMWSRSQGQILSCFGIEHKSCCLTRGSVGTDEPGNRKEVSRLQGAFHGSVIVGLVLRLTRPGLLCSLGMVAVHLIHRMVLMCDVGAVVPVSVSGACPLLGTRACISPQRVCVLMCLLGCSIRCAASGKYLCTSGVRRGWHGVLRQL